MDTKVDMLQSNPDLGIQLVKLLTYKSVVDADNLRRLYRRGRRSWDK